MRVYPFKGWHPKKETAKDIISLPYDVVSRKEAAEIINKNPNSFMKVIRPDACFDESISSYDARIYEAADQTINKLKKEQLIERDEQNHFYLYKQIMGNHEQLGLVATCHIDDYINNKILKHELTRKEKQEDRTRHITTTNHNTGPVFLFYKEESDLNSLLEEYIGNKTPFFDIETEDKIKHKFWIVDDIDFIDTIKSRVEDFSCFYIADGHHRAASSVSAGLRIRESEGNQKGDNDYEHFLAIIFPAKQLKILDYNRVIKDLNGHTPEELLNKIENLFIVKNIEKEKSTAPKPKQRHTISMFLNNKWYQLMPKFTVDEKDPLGSLDVNILYDNILKPMLDIGDPRTDSRIDFVGGIRGIEELEKLVQSGEFQVAFAMFPTSIDELIKISDSDLIMPPKSTWFEPKLRSGMILHQLK